MTLKATSKKARRQAKRLFLRKPHQTRPFTSADYQALPKGETITGKTA